MDILHHLDTLADLIWKDAIVVLSIIWVYDGARILAVGGQSRKGVKALVSGLSLLIIMIALGLWVSHTMGQVSALMSSAPRTELPANWGTDVPPERREYVSRALASIAYVDNGILRKYFDKESGWKTYCPTVKDIESRDQYVITKTQLEQVEKDASSSVYPWLTLGFISALIGWFTGRNERKAKPPLNPDAGLALKK